MYFAVSFSYFVVLQNDGLRKILNFLNVKSLLVVVIKYKQHKNTTNKFVKFITIFDEFNDCLKSF